MNKEKNIKLPITFKVIMVIAFEILCIEIALMQNYYRIDLIIHIILVITFITICIIMFSFFNQTRKFKKSINEIIHGNIDKKVPTYGDYEIFNVSQTLDKILCDLLYIIEEKEIVISDFHKFIPYEMIEILNKKDITKIVLEDQVNSEGAILTINTVLLSELVHTMESKETFAFINTILSQTIPVIWERGGLIDKFTDTGLTALFIQSNENALNSAISICDVLNKLNVHFSIGLSYGNVMIGVVGHEKRKSFLTLSSYTGLSSFLQEVAYKYNSKILVTSTFLNQIENYHIKYCIRCIGYFYISSTDTLEKIYDVFDGDSIEIRQIKKKTKILFEQGVNLYSALKFEEARLHFIEVLKVYRMDNASKEYLYLCDKFIEPENRHNGNVYIESY